MSLLGILKKTEVNKWAEYSSIYSKSNGLEVISEILSQRNLLYLKIKNEVPAK